MNQTRGITLLWALRSPCNLGCKYCYFGIVEEQRSRTLPLRPGELSHSGRNDLCLDAILGFIESFTPDLVHRVFIAGGEPLLWDGCYRVISALKAIGTEVVVSTNGLPLMDEGTSAWLVENDVDAVSVSLDSHDPEYNDCWRVDRGGKGWHGVVSGIRTLLQERSNNMGRVKVGVNTVVTRHNMDHIVATGRLVAELGVDYFVIQPVSLAPSHPLHSTLSLNVHHHGVLSAAIQELNTVGLQLCLPNGDYLNLMLGTLTSGTLPIIRGCFGGRDLFFIEPDGSVWDCPSMYKIASTQACHRLSIVGRTADQVFSSERRKRDTDCSLCSLDCVNMWQLMAFDEILVDTCNVQLLP